MVKFSLDLVQISIRLIQGRSTLAYISKTCSKFSICLILFTILVPQVALAQDLDEDWLRPEVSAQNVNEGNLVFLLKPPVKAVHFHKNTFIISQSSLQDGWVRLQQCHENLDPVEKLQIVYHKTKIRNMRIRSYKRIARAWVDLPTSSIQLEHIGKHAKLCMEAESLSLQHKDKKFYYLRNGPFMRKFLDGYYPMRVSVNVKMPSSKLQLIRVSPAEQKGFTIRQSENSVGYDAWFEGRLYSEMIFKLLN